MSHRALILSAMAHGTSEVVNAGPGQDIATTRTAIEALGIAIDGDRLVSPGISGWGVPKSVIDCGNSGTTMRLLAGALSARPFETVLTGDESLTTRPMARLRDPLQALGARIVLSDGDTAPKSRSVQRSRASTPVI